MGKRQQTDGLANTSGEVKCIRVLVADDHPLIRAGLVSVLVSELDMLLIGEAINGKETQRLCWEQKPDVLLLDLRMPGPSALETVAYLRQHSPGTRVLILTAYDDDAHVRGLVAAGVAGYLLKEEAPAMVVQAIRAVVGGGTWFSQGVMARLAQPKLPSTLTQREREVLRLVAEGKTNRQVAEALHVAEVTVRFHLRKIYAKIGAHTRSEAVRWAVQHELGKDLS